MQPFRISMGAYGRAPYSFAFAAAPHGAMGKSHGDDRADADPTAIPERQKFLERFDEARETTGSFAGDDARHDDDDEPRFDRAEGSRPCAGRFVLCTVGSALVKRPRRLLNPAFRAAVYESTLPRHAMAQLIGYGAHPSNLFTDLRRGRAEGLSQTLSICQRMAKLAQLVGFPEEQVWLP